MKYKLTWVTTNADLKIDPTYSLGNKVQENTFDTVKQAEHFGPLCWKDTELQKLYFFWIIEEV